MRIPIWSVCFFLFSGVIPANILMRPYLQCVTTTSVYVLVECDSTAPATVRFGPTDAYGQTATTESVRATTQTNSWVHRVKLTGLMPESTYHYVALHGSSTSTDAVFCTAVPSGIPFRFAFLADFRTGRRFMTPLQARFWPEIHDSIFMTEIFATTEHTACGKRSSSEPLN